MVYPFFWNKSSMKNKPLNRKELELLIRNEKISLGDIDVTNITDMSRLFQDFYERDDYAGLEIMNVII